MLKGVPYFSDTQVIELTRAEYDALPASKYTDGVLYCIKDEGVMKGDTFSPIIYSLTEREVGVWIDGKPLYQKSFCFTPSSLDETINLSFLDIKDIISGAGYWTRYSGNVYTQYPLGDCETPSFSGYDINVRYEVANGNLRFIISGYGAEDVNQIRYTLQYTKTTDNPGTGRWTPSGVPAHHYSTEEQVIGTWIDGKTLYEKTFTVTSFTYEDWINAVDVTSLNIDKCLKISGYVKRNNANGLCLSYNGSYYENATYYFMIRNYNKKIQYIIMGYRDFSEMSITIQYTKTS